MYLNDAIAFYATLAVSVRSIKALFSCLEEHIPKLSQENITLKRRRLTS